MKSIKYLFLMFILLLSFTTTSCKKTHEHEYIGGYCNCGESNKTEFRISFVDHEGTILKEQYVSKNSAATAPTPPIRYGYEFIGWSCDFSKVNKDLVISAKYNKIEYVTVTFDADNDTETNILNVSFNSPATEPSVPIKTGHKFLGWYKDEVKWDFKKNIDEDIILKAKWEKCSYTLTYNLNGGKGNIITLTQEYGSYIEPIIPYKQYAKFIGWTIDIPLYMPDYDITVEAVWEENEFLDKCIYENGECIQYNGTDSEIVIPFSLYENGEKITYVPYNILRNNKYIRKITIAEGYNSIGFDAFDGCDNLKSLILADTLLYINLYTLRDLSKLKYNIYNGACYLGTPSNPYHLIVKLEKESLDSLVIHENTLTMASIDMFNEVENLVIPEKLEVINHSFQYMGKCVIEKGIKYLGPVSNPYKFVIGLESRNVEVVTINENSKIIIPGAFYGSKIKTLTIPNGVEKIDELAFEGCYNLETLYISSSVKYVGTNICKDCLNVKIYCEFESKPSAWDKYWNDLDCDGIDDHTVIWNN